ncbi:MAG TPA: hypothetical protein VI319_01130 [Burkholderiales bacterium]
MLGRSLPLPLAFFASGAAALLFQVLWFRALGRVLGNTVWAGAAVLAGFMLGMALGGLLAARFAPRIRDAARAFALAEATVGLTGSLLVWGLPALEPVAGQWLAPLASHPAASAAARFALAVAVMLVPTIAMGTTLALGVRAHARDDTVRSLGALYAANTFGACVAPLLAEYVLIGAFGLRGTALVASGLNLAAAALALAHRRAVAAPPVSHTTSPRRLPARTLLAAAAAGAFALGLEVVWFRLLVLYEPGSDTMFALMLTIVLLGIAAGGAIAPLLARAGSAWVGAGASLAVVAGYLLSAPDRPDVAAQALNLMLPAAVLSGSFFTLLGAELRGDSGDPQPAIGALMTANTLGAAAGAALAALVLLPRLGIETGVFTLAAGYALLPLLLARPMKRSALPLVAAAVGLLLFPFGRIDGHLSAAARPYEGSDDARVVRITQGPTTTLQLLEHDRFGEPAAWRLLTDGYSMTAIDTRAMRYMRMFAWLPLALHPDPHRALLISYGAGNTAQALLSDPGMRALTVVDVSTEILGASPVVHGAQDPLADPRVRLVLEDGRHYLRTRRDQFDIITSEPPPPLIAGVVNLYTREYFTALAQHLRPGGLATYWLPISQFKSVGARAVVRAFCEAFPDCTLWTGVARDWILMGGREFGARPSAEHFSRLWRDAVAGARMAEDGLERPAQLGATFLADAEQLRRWYEGTPALTDDFPKRIAPDDGIKRPMTEYAAWLRPDDARSRFHESRWIAAHWPTPLAGAADPFFAVQPALNGDIGGDPARSLASVDLLLRGTDLRIPVMWLLGSNVTEQKIVNRKIGLEGRRPEFSYPLAVRALAGRDYALAAKLFAEVAERGNRSAGVLAAYALCRAKRPKPDGACVAAVTAMSSASAASPPSRP